MYLSFERLRPRSFQARMTIFGILLFFFSALLVVGFSGFFLHREFETRLESTSVRLYTNFHWKALWSLQTYFQFRKSQTTQTAQRFPRKTFEYLRKISYGLHELL